MTFAARVWLSPHNPGRSKPDTGLDTVKDASRRASAVAFCHPGPRPARCHDEKQAGMKKRLFDRTKKPGDGSGPMGTKQETCCPCARSKVYPCGRLPLPFLSLGLDVRMSRHHIPSEQNCHDKQSCRALLMDFIESQDISKSFGFGVCGIFRLGSPPMTEWEAKHSGFNRPRHAYEHETFAQRAHQSGVDAAARSRIRWVGRRG
jgi:hypothetical protein